MAKDLGALVEQAREKLSKLTGLKSSSTIRAAEDEKGWRISIEMVEKESIPDQMDILALYEVLLDKDGNLLSFERKGMRKRVDTTISATEDGTIST